MQKGDQQYFEARGMQALGLASAFADQIHKVVTNAPLLEEFTLAEIKTLGAHMPVYEARAGTVVIGEGDTGDFMVVLISGSMEVTRLDRTGIPSRIAVVQEGYALGEMSMLDGEPRFASCIALETVRFAVLDRTLLSQVIAVEPKLGAKILIKLVHMLAQRLRNISTRLMNVLEQRSTEADALTEPIE